MKLLRRHFLHLAAGAAAALPAVSRIARAQAYPTRPVRLIVGFPAGGVVDVIARLMGQWLSERLGQPFIVENRVGAVGNLATEAVVKAPADGHTLLLINAINTINATLYSNLNFDFVRDIAPVGSISRGPGVMIVTPTFPAKSIPEFITYAKANPGRINMASAGIGSTQHVYGELFKMLAGIDLLHVPYRGGPQAITDLVGGQVHVMFDPLANSIEQIKAGKLRALGVTTASRSPAIPDVPAIGEFLPGYEASGWQGIGAPKNTPAAVIATLNKEIAAGVLDPTIRTRISNLGYAPFESSIVDFREFVAADAQKWAKVIKFAGIK